MTILYRRFLLVAAFIAAMGAITANLIQETRSAGTHPVNGLERIQPAPCMQGFYCANSKASYDMNRVMRG